ncbi:ABC transporter ATP-binding protein [Microbacterium laevaniformans]|uniref:ABC transporter ATP-binding protein n=2 Tax=Microbacterium TaxID=33882 RepID=A0A4S2D880_9MICO|nr:MULTISPECIES: ABC transporter ATP-binding protein [Microbacterium]AXA95540.1 ABC transporter ATP-binding protein [Microbacterium sp. PM5]KIC57751.1 peptide ABC transporter ATPase [Microbacterium hominis]MBM7752855.1 peptide/nickel transport system ATP-binding protein [Microbacterium laevaniformans]TGY37918.1 ABC transporter ATP-binding protein [Microbacterium laevaniformans]GLJ64098.1 putative oligopeptide ABC transporter, ATP-binding protein [Microbacterium laevaniformans]
MRTSRGMLPTTEAHQPDSGPVLEVTDLNVDFGVDGYWVPAARHVSYSIAAGEVLAIVGESGSGKSVSSMSLLGLLPKNSRVSGSAKLAGRELIGMKPREMQEIRGNQISMIFQEPMTALNPVLTVGFQIVETLRQHFGVSPAEAKARAVELLTLVELPDPQKAFDSYPHQLSGGQRQRAMIAQSLSCDPLLLVADEPTTALDVTVQAEILELMRKLQDRLGSAILLITHDMGVVADMADRIVVMRQGDIVETGTVASVFADPQHPYTKALLSAVPRITTEDLQAPDAATPSTPVVVSFDDVAIEYPKRGRVPAFRAADHIDLKIYQGEVLGLVGESGSGKTTIGRATIGLLPIHSGRLTVAGMDISKANREQLHALHHEVGIVFQDPSSSLNPRMTIGDSIAEPIKLSEKIKGAPLDKRVRALLDSVRLPRDYASRYPHELSGGQKQRVGIARALALNPKVLVADEPTSALDVSVQATVLELLKDLQRERGFACLFISHDLAVIDELADRIAVMRHGALVEVGTRDQIMRRPQQAYTKRLLAAVPVPDPDIQRERRDKRLADLAAGVDADETPGDAAAHA